MMNYSYADDEETIVWSEKADDVFLDEYNVKDKVNNFEMFLDGWMDDCRIDPLVWVGWPCLTRVFRSFVVA
jgi:hypothetical protein